MALPVEAPVPYDDQQSCDVGPMSSKQDVYDGGIPQYNPFDIAGASQLLDPYGDMPGG